MKIKCVFLVIFVACFFEQAAGQEQKYSSMNLHFVYIDHETSTPVNKLCERLRTLRDDALEVEDALILYLADGQSPRVSLVNLVDMHGKQRDQTDAYTGIISALQDANSHDVIAREDRRHIIDLFDEFNFVDESGQLHFNSVIMDFYVGSSFWSLGNNEKIIAHLFTIFKASSFTRDKFAFNVYKPRGIELSYEKGMPFGDNNIDDINNKLSIFDY